MIFIQVIHSCPGGRFQLSGGGSKMTEHIVLQKTSLQVLQIIGGF